MSAIKHWDASAIDDLEQRFRVNLINSLSGFKSANLIGTVDVSGNHNLAIVSSVVHLGANPPLIAFINRPDTVERHTLDNIEATGCFTVNQVNADCWQQAHQTSASYPREISEFAAVGLTPELLGGCSAPFVLESRLRFACALVERQQLAVNGTVMVIGRITDLYVADNAVQDDGYIDIEQLGTVAVSGLDSYHKTHRLGRLEYAKPEKSPRKLKY